MAKATKERTKVCPRCGVERPVTDFAKNRTMKDGLQYYCSPCRKEQKDAKRPETITVTRTRAGRVQEYRRRGANHGQSRTPLYRIWKGMRERCNNPKAQNYQWYGAKGIKVCPEWQGDFLAFKVWAETHGYEPGMQLDRVKNEKNYEPSNCRWVTRIKNLQNRSLYLDEVLEERLRQEAERRGVGVYVLIREAVEEYLSPVPSKRGR